jgi:hypothetical protein
MPWPDLQAELVLGGRFFAIGAGARLLPAMAICLCGALFRTFSFRRCRILPIGMINAGTTEWIMARLTKTLSRWEARNLHRNILFRLFMRVTGKITYWKMHVYNPIKDVLVKKPATTDWMEAWLIATVRQGANKVLAKETSIQQLIALELLKWKENFPRATPESLESVKGLLCEALVKELEKPSAQRQIVI